MPPPTHTQAAKQLALMQEEEEDATLTQLTSAWIGLYQAQI